MSRNRNTNTDAAELEQAQTNDDGQAQAEAQANAETEAQVTEAQQEEAQAQVAEAEQTETAQAIPDAGVPTLTRLANKGIDPSNTYEYGAAGPVNSAVPEGAEVITDFEAAQERGYIGYSPGYAATQQLTLAEAGKRNQRVRERQREANRAVLNRSAAAEEADSK